MVLAMAAESALCAPVAPGAEAQRQAEMGRALAAWLAGKPGGDARTAVAGLAECLDVVALEGALDVATVRPKGLAGYPQGHLVYRAGDRWVVAPQEREGGTIGPYRTVTGPAKDRQLIASWGRPGTGIYGRIQLYRLGPKFELLWESPEYEKFGMEVLDPDWVSATYRTPQTWEEPHALQANCCLPVDGQTLWQRQGNAFVKKGERLIPNSYRAVSLFVGALRKGDKATAGKWAASPAVVEEGTRVLSQIDTSSWAQSDRDEEDEELWWEAIPPRLRGPKPSRTRIVWPSGPVKLVTERVGDQWKVAWIERR
ncbi:MAG TPA: hypothetical protein VNT75_24085 [Symbiobacteriaceae bacterium]|nr:hypothetical protein [Symbiobacteriaceae bacterium]